MQQIYKKKYKIDEFNSKKLDFDLFYSSQILSKDDLILGKKLIYLTSLCNLYAEQDCFINILKFFKEIDDKIPSIMSLPETITHNDAHPLNFLKSDDDIVHLIDFDRAGRNKKICDLGLTLITNDPDDRVIRAIFDGYGQCCRLNSKELELLYEFYILSFITSFVREVTELSNYNCASLAKHICSPRKILSKIENIRLLSQKNNLKEIWSDMIRDNLEGLDLTSDKRLSSVKISRDKFQ